MKAFTLTLADSPESFEVLVPTEWADVTLAQFVRLQTEPETPRLCILTSLTREQLDQLPDSDGQMLYRRLDFVDDLRDLDALQPTAQRWPSSIAMHGQVRLMGQFLEQHPDQDAFFYAPYMYALTHCNWQEPDVLQACYETVLQQPVVHVYADVMQALRESHDTENAPDAPTMLRIARPAATERERGPITSFFRKLLPKRRTVRPHAHG